MHYFPLTEAYAWPSLLENQESLSVHAYPGSSAAHNNTEEHEDMKLSSTTSAKCQMQSGISSIVFNATNM